MNLVQFKKSSNSNDGEVSYHIKFDDGYEAFITARQLRDGCPCAMCRGEEVLLHKYMPEPLAVEAIGYILEKAEMVGNYAIQLSWKDGHNTGIFTWDYLRKICDNSSIT